MSDPIQEVIDENASNWVDDYFDDVDGAINFGVGQVLEKAGGEMEPGAVRDRLESELHDRNSPELHFVVMRNPPEVNCCYAESIYEDVEDAEAAAEKMPFGYVATAPLKEK